MIAVVVIPLLTVVLTLHLIERFRFKGSVCAYCHTEAWRDPNNTVCSGCRTYTCQPCAPCARRLHLWGLTP